MYGGPAKIGFNRVERDLAPPESRQLFSLLARGVAGIALGVAAGNGLAVWMKASIVFPWDWAAIGLVVCTVIGVGAGLYPAVKASRLDPIESLRFE